MAKIGLLFFVMLLLGCEKPDPNPELTDSIYQDLRAQAEVAEKASEAEEKKLEGFKKDLEKAQPQTGDTKIAQKRFFETERKIQQLRQEHAYLVLRSKARKSEVQKAYAIDFAAKKPWDRSEERESYEAYKKAREVPASWDAKRRIANYAKETGFGTPVGEKAKEGGEKKEAKKE